MPRRPHVGVSETYAVLFDRGLYSAEDALKWLKGHRLHAIDLMPEGAHWRAHLKPYANGYRYRYHPLGDGIELLLRFRN